MAIGGDRRDDPIRMLDPGEWTIQDDDVRAYVREPTRELSSLVRSTLGPIGLEKLIHTQDSKGRPTIIQTADGGEILDALEKSEDITHPVGALFIDHVDSMQRGLSDGTTTAIVLADALIARGLDLIEQGVSPTNVVIGYALAANRAGSVLDDLVQPVSADDPEILRAVATTSMTALDLSEEERTEIATMVVDAIQAIANATESSWLETDDVKILARTGVDTNLYQGLVIRRWPGPADENEDANIEFDYDLAYPNPTKDVKVALIEGDIEFEKTASVLYRQGHQGTRLSPEAASDYGAAREQKAHATARRLQEAGTDVIVTHERLDDLIKSIFQTVGLAVIDGAKYPKTDLQRLARATGATVEPTVDDVSRDSLGTAGTVVEEWVGEERWTIFDDCTGSVFTIVVDAVNEVAATQRKRLVEDAVEVTGLAVIDGQVLPGAGGPALAIAADLREYAPNIADESQLAVEAFAESIETIVQVLAVNAGHDPIDVLTSLRAETRSQPDRVVGIDVTSGGMIDPWAEGIIEPRRVFSQAIETARAATEQLLTVDSVLFPGVDFDSFNPVTEHE